LHGYPEKNYKKALELFIKALSEDYFEAYGYIGFIYLKVNI
jgi:hypothetical protein